MFVYENLIMFFKASNMWSYKVFVFVHNDLHVKLAKCSIALNTEHLINAYKKKIRKLGARRLSECL